MEGRTVNEQPEMAVLAEAGVRELKALRGVLAEAGIEAHIVRPPATRNT
jgi:hypothetical protein